MILKYCVLMGLSRLIPNRQSVEHPPDLRGKRVLVIMLTHIGDAVIHRFVLDSVLESAEGESVDLVVKPPVDELFRGQTKLRQVYDFRCPWVGASRWPHGLLHWARLLIFLRKNKYDVAVVTHPHELSSVMARLSGAKFSTGWARDGDFFLDLPLRPNGACIHASDYGRILLEALGSPAATPSAEIHVAPKDYVEGRKILKSVQEKLRQSAHKLVAIHPGAGGDQKIWPYRNFSAVAENLIRQGYGVVLLGGRKETDVCRHIFSRLERHQLAANLSELSLNLGQMTGVLAGADLYLGNDSGPSHMAAALGTPSVVIFGPFSDSAVWAPRGPRVKVLQFDNEDFYAARSAKTVQHAVRELLNVRPDHSDPPHDMAVADIEWM